MAYELRGDRRYLMPIHFGPSLGPRQSPTGGAFDNRRFSTFAIVVRCGAPPTSLESLLPSGFSLLAPEATVSFRYFTDIPWLAGRGYNVLTVSVPARYEGRRDQVDGDLMLVVWESLPEPIITGREELGMAKIFGDVPDAEVAGGRVVCRARWDGFEFATLEYRENGGPRGADWPPPRPVLNLKYVPATGGALGVADARYVTLQPVAEEGVMRVVDSGFGEASLTFASATWAQMPTQYTIVNALHELGLTGGPARWTRTLGVDDGRGQRRLE